MSGGPPPYPFPLVLGQYSGQYVLSNGEEDWITIDVTHQAGRSFAGSVVQDFGGGLAYRDTVARLSGTVTRDGLVRLNCVGRDSDPGTSDGKGRLFSEMAAGSSVMALSSPEWWTANLRGAKPVLVQTSYLATISLQVTRHEAGHALVGNVTLSLKTGA